MLAHKRPPQLWRYTDMIEQAVKHVDLFIAPSEFTMNKHLETGLKIPVVELPYFTSRWERHDTSLGGLPARFRISFSSGGW